MSDTAKLARILGESGDPGNPDPERLRETVEAVRTIAVVGLSRDPTKAARRVPSYLAAKGFEVIPVNPNADRILGRRSHAELDDVSEPVDLVLIFRPSAEAGAAVEQAAKRSERPVIWLQEGIRSDEAVSRARKDGSIVIQDLCIFKVHRALEQHLPLPARPSR